MSGPQRSLDDLTLGTQLTSHEVAELLQVNPSSINNWSRQGVIPMYRTPGGHRRFIVEELIGFIEANGYPMPKRLEKLAATKVLWVDSDGRGRSRVEKAFGDDKGARLTLVASAAVGLLVAGELKPNVFVLDTRTMDIPASAVARALHEAAPAIRFVVVGEALSGDAPKTARFERTTAPRDVVAGALEAARQS